MAVPNYLVVNRSMDPELAYQLTKLLFDRKAALAEVHPSARRLELETSCARALARFVSNRSPTLGWISVG